MENVLKAINIFKSICVVAFLVAIIGISVFVTHKCVLRQKNERAVRLVVLSAACWFFAAVAFVCFGDYVYPFERELHPELVATVEVPPEHAPYEGLIGDWHAVYEQYGSYPGTWVHHHEYYQKRYLGGRKWIWRITPISSPIVRG